MDWLQFYWEWLRRAFSKPWLIADGAAFGIFVVSALILQFVPSWESTMTALAWQIPLGVLAVLTGLRLLIAPYWLHKELKRELTQTAEERDEAKRQAHALPDQLTSSHLQGLNIRINDLAREEPFVRNRTFVDCHIYGPAVLVLDGCTLRGITFDTPIDSLFILVTQERAWGVIKIENCIFKDCRFMKIGIAGSAEFKQLVEGSIVQ